MELGATAANLATAPNGHTHRYWLYWLGFYLGIPILLALQLGASESGSATFIAKRYYFLYFLVACLPNWWAMDIVTRVARRVLQPWHPPLALVLVVGAVLAMNVSGTWAPLRQSLFEPYLAEGSQFYSVYPWRYSDPDYLMEAVVAWITGSCVWLGANYFFLQVLGFPRYGYASRASYDVAAPGQSDVVAAPSSSNILLDQLPENLGRNVVALKAEEHYTHVYTDKGESLVLMRFRDAVGLLEEFGGVQTHRSYWVNPNFVADLERDGRNSRIRLTTGLEIPVSRSYRVLVQQALDGRAAVA